MEDNVYVCTWTKSPSGYVLSLKARPRISVRGATYEVAEERLIEAIQAASGAMHAVLEFDPPLPKSELEARYSKPEIYLVSGDDRFETDTGKARLSDTTAEIDEYLERVDVFYQSPVCRRCKHSSSPRSDRPLSLSYARSGYDGAFGSVGQFGSNSIQLLSEEFLELLSPEERGTLELRLVNRKGRARKKFYELLGPSGPAYVAVAGMKISGWRCADCGYRTWGYWIEGSSIHCFIAKSDLQTPLPGIFTVGIQPGVDLAVTAERWKTLVGRKGTRGFASQPLGIVADHVVVRIPELQVK